MTQALGMEGPISMASASRLPSSMTVRARKGRPSYRASAMKSSAQVSFKRMGAPRGAAGGARAPLAPPREIQPEPTVHARHAFMVSAMPGAPEAIEALPEPRTTVPDHDLVQRRDDVGVPQQAGPWRPVVRRTRPPHRLTGAPDRDPVLLHQRGHDLAFRGRRRRFRLRTSLIAAFYRASSAYICFSLACSASSSFK